MKQLTVISGKGGTGKTSLVGGFAALAQNAVVADCDVDAPDLHILLNPKVQETREFTGLKEAVINHENCTECGECYKHCKFNAISKDIQLNALKCEGCGVCAYVCPVDAIQMKERNSGMVYISKTKFGPMVHAKLNIGEEASGLLVVKVRNAAKKIAEKTKRGLIIVDGSPGIGCPVIASLTGADLALIVTEPTLSGLHDMERVYNAANHFGIKSVVCINKYDINEENTEKIEQYCTAHGIDIVGKIPYDLAFTDAMMKGKTIIEYNSDPRVKNIWKKIEERMQ
ncbi:MAG: ATP-binding protein [Euryarchaeota archaeon]|nr:ATP-binding protein [Euryarchaeota archaeon]